MSTLLEGAPAGALPNPITTESVEISGAEALGTFSDPTLESIGYAAITLGQPDSRYCYSAPLSDERGNLLPPIPNEDLRQADWPFETGFNANLFFKRNLPLAIVNAYRKARPVGWTDRVPVCTERPHMRQWLQLVLLLLRPVMAGKCWRTTRFHAYAWVNMAHLTGEAPQKVV